MEIVKQGHSYDGTTNMCIYDDDCGCACDDSSDSFCVCDD